MTQVAERRYRVNEMTPDPSVVFDRSIAEQYLVYARMLAARGLVYSSTGNLVMRVPHPNYPDGVCYVKCMGVSLEEMSINDLVITDVPHRAHPLRQPRHDGRSSDESRDSAVCDPTSTRSSTCTTTRPSPSSRPDIEEAAVHGAHLPVPVQSYPHYLPAHINVEDDVAPIKTFIQNTNVVIMKRHGFTVLGRTVSECYGRTNVLVGEVKRNIIAEQLAALRGTRPEYISREEAELMFKHGDSVMYPSPVTS